MLKTLEAISPGVLTEVARRSLGLPAFTLIDWAFCGPGGLGNDLGELIGTSLSCFAVDPANAGELEAVMLEDYLAGLREAGWSGDERLARLGYLISLALYWEFIPLPGYTDG